MILRRYKERIHLSATLGSFNGSTTTTTSYVDANGKNGKFPQLHTQKWGFNQLEIRVKSLCELLSEPCAPTLGGGSPTPNPIKVLKHLADIKTLPLPKGSH